MIKLMNASFRRKVVSRPLESIANGLNTLNGPNVRNRKVNALPMENGGSTYVLDVVCANAIIGETSSVALTASDMNLNWIDMAQVRPFKRDREGSKKNMP